MSVRIAERSALRSVASAILLGCVAIIGEAGIGDRALAQKAGKVSYNIPAGSLGIALTRWAKASGLKLLAPGSVLQGRTTPGLSGSYEPYQALDALLANSGLTHSTSGNTVTVTDPSASGNNAGATVEGAIALDTIEVSGASAASAAADAPYQTPGSSAYISGEQIQRVPPSSTGDIFKTTPGVISAGNRNGASVDVNIRGLQGNNRVNVMVDGTQQSTSMYRGYGGHDSRVYVDPELIGGIGIEKGPSAGPYGAGAMGGVVNMETLGVQDIVKEGQTGGARVRTSFGSNSLPVPNPTPAGVNNVSPRNQESGLFEDESFIGSVAVATTTQNVDLVGAFARRKNGNYSAGTHGALTTRTANGVTHQLSPYKYGDEVFNTSQDVTSGLFKGTVRYEDHSLQLGYVRYENDFGYVSPLTTQFNWRRQEPLSNTATNTYTSRYKYNPDSELVDFQANLWRATTESSLQQSGAPQDTASDNWGTEAWNDFRINPGFGALKLRLGGSHSHEYSETLYQYASIGYVLEAMEGNRDLSSAFSEADLKVTDWLSLSGSLRYDSYKLDGPIYNIKVTPIAGGLFRSDLIQVGEREAEGSRWNPAAGVTITPFEGVQLFGRYSEGFRPPSVREAFLGGDATGIDIAPNPNLKPEVAKNYEAGVNVLRRDLFADNDVFKTKIAYFDNTYEDYIVRMNWKMAGLPTPVATDSWGNIDAAKFKGIEWSVDYDTGVVFASGNINYYTDIQYCAPPLTPLNAPSRCARETFGRDYGGDYVPPEYMASATLGTRLLDEKLTLGARATIFGERTLPYSGQATIAPTLWAKTAVYDAFGSYELVEDRVLNFSIENVFDRYYVDPLGVGRNPAPGRTVRVGASAQF